MLEAPSIILLCQQAKHFIGQKVTAIEGDETDFETSRLWNCPLLALRTFGKELLLCFPNFTISLTFPPSAAFAINAVENLPLHLAIRFEKGSIFFYRTQSTLIEQPIEEVYDFRAEVMNELWDGDLAYEKLLQIPQHSIGKALRCQNIFSGVGNKISDEVLYRLKIHPHSLVGSIPKAKLKELIDETVKISFEMLDWLLDGSAENHLLVHNKQLCPGDLRPLKYEEDDELENSYYCEQCQILFR
ncbi:hypothetical protein [Pedobacter sp. SYSU D00535]|uniref:hypothetical protein n=1 Tax=Pedobacter sp. SYSU D00535 TaxID=2810308 RepID=UPI001A958EBC|nr:hypothetical protein [Pedobacter sp. SYSU D00535]